MLIKNRYVFIVISIMSFGLSGCFDSETPPTELQFDVKLQWKNSAVNCQNTLQTGDENPPWFIEQLQFFLSDIEVGSNALGWQKLNLTNTPLQAHNTVLLGTKCQSENALLSLKSGEKNSTKSSEERDEEYNSTSNANWAIKFSADTTLLLNEKSYVRFTLGVPFEINHLNPISQPSPLNLPSMFWIWQTGHKFLRLELASHHEHWLFHLGSTGCKSMSAMRAPQNNCLYPNRFMYELPLVKNVQDNFALNIDLAGLLKNIELSALSSCQSEQDNKSCQQLFNNLSSNEKISDLADFDGLFKTFNTQHVIEGSGGE